MSRETVIALRRFTTKLANSPTMGPVMSSFDSVRPRDSVLLDDPSRPSTYSIHNAPEGIVRTTGAVPHDTPKSLDGSLALNTPAKPLTETGDLEDSMREAEKARERSEPIVAGGGVNPQPEQSWSDYLQSLMGNVDWNTVGGAGIGGLGAYGLARLLQNDEDKKKFPWLATALGVGAGGFLAPHLVPMAHNAGSAMYNGIANGINAVRGGGQASA